MRLSAEKTVRSRSRRDAVATAALALALAATPLLAGCASSGTDVASEGDEPATAAAGPSSDVLDAAEAVENAATQGQADEHDAAIEQDAAAANEPAEAAGDAEAQAAPEDAGAVDGSADEGAADQANPSADAKSDEDTFAGEAQDGEVSSQEVTADADAASDAADEDAEPAFSPSDGIDDDGHWAGVTALDYVTLPDYAGIEVPASAITVSTEDVDAQVGSIASSYTTTEQVTDRAVQDGDTVNIDYVGSIAGVAFDGGSTQGNGTLVTIGVTNYIDDFLEQLIGHMPGENFDIEVTFPEDYGNVELNGQDAVFNITINYINETVAPVIDDAFVSSTLKDSYGWETVDQMREQIEAGLASQLLDQYVQTYVFDNAEVSEVPQGMVDYQEASMVDYYTQYAAMYGMTVENMLPIIAGVSSVDELIEANRDQIDDAARSCLVIQAVAEDAGITVDDDGVAQYFEAMMNVTDLSAFEEQYGMPYLKLVTLNDAVIDYLATNAVVAEDAQEQ